MKQYAPRNGPPGFFNAEYLLIPVIYAIYFAAMLPCASRLGHGHGGWLLALLSAPVLCQGAAYLEARWRRKCSPGSASPHVLIGSLLLLALMAAGAIVAGAFRVLSRFS